MSGVVRIRTNAKLNLFLRVMGLRTDGYHEVETILHGINLADEIEVEPTTTAGFDIDMQLEEGMAGVLPDPEDNFVVAVAHRLLELGAKNDGIAVRLRKRIPMAAGLGGGSGNAAGALVVLNELWKMDLDRQGLLDIAAHVGSDIPYCIQGGTALATGRGEKLTTLPAPETMWFVLGISEDPMSTAEVYDAWDAMEAKENDERSSAAMTLALGAGDARDVAQLLHNDLEIVAFGLRPDLEQRKESMLKAGALGACVSGAGPTIFGMAEDENHAREVAEGIESLFDRVEVVRSQPDCIERLD